ncbi:MAG: hypothetical protein CMO82_11160 [Winogradskyella sp.]|nr:hypothetical protein [Winogradskyella sp.]|tara:strand:+ start:233 stop:448 length:216 start_codon:yes stop_codon:yes gene_type:complete
MSNHLLPKGIIPERIHHFSRKEDLKEAIIRYLNAELQVPEQWIEEHNRLVNQGYISLEASELRKKYPHVSQ